MRKRFVLAGSVVVVALGARGLISLTGGASTPFSGPDVATTTVLTAGDAVS